MSIPNSGAAEAPLVELRRVSKSYQAGAEPLPVLREIDFTLRAGETVAIVGASGSGKSTLLNILGTLDHADEGEVLVAGQPVTGLSESELARVRNRDIGFIFQLHHLLPQCSVLENVLVPTLAGGAPPAGSPRERARRLLERAGLSHRLDHRPAQLSGGERLRAAVVRALINSPRLLLADEPTGSLDRKGSENLTELLLELNAEEGTGLVVVTHSMPLARKLSRVLELEDGRLSPAGPSD